jgi:hypothetical protein
MRMNWYGAIELVIICAACTVLKLRGAFIPAIVLLVVLYGGTLLIISITAEPASQGAIERQGAKLEALALHGSFALGLATLLLEFKGQPLISLAMVPLAFIVAHCFTWTTWTPTGCGIELNRLNLIAIAPAVLLVSITACQKWNPIWYLYAALACYCWLLYRNSDPEPGPVRDRARISIYSSLVLFSLGLLVNINNTVMPHWLHGTAFTYHITLRIIFLIGCAIAGLVIPFLIVSVRETPEQQET